MNTCVNTSMMYLSVVDAMGMAKIQFGSYAYAMKKYCWPSMAQAGRAPVLSVYMVPLCLSANGA